MQFLFKLNSFVGIEESIKHFLSFNKERLEESDVEMFGRSICNDEIVKAVKKNGK